jgi:hypothetical protein
LSVLVHHAKIELGVYVSLVGGFAIQCRFILLDGRGLTVLSGTTLLTELCEIWNLSIARNAIDRSGSGLRLRCPAFQANFALDEMAAPHSMHLEAAELSAGK